MPDPAPPIATLLTARLRLRPFTPDDAAFALELLNDPDWIRNIGDRGVRTLDQGRDYLVNGPMSGYARDGHGLLAVERRDDGLLIGMCGLLRRETLPDPDIGFAMLAAHRGRGYTVEAARAVLDHARDQLGVRRVCAIVLPANAASVAVLKRLGLQDHGDFRLAGDSETLRLFAANL